MRRQMLEFGVTITAYHSKKIPYLLFIDHWFFCKYSNITYSLGCVYFNTNNCNCSLHLNTSLLLCRRVRVSCHCPKCCTCDWSRLHWKYTMPINLITCFIACIYGFVSTKTSEWSISNGHHHSNCVREVHGYLCFFRRIFSNLSWINPRVLSH